MIIALKCRNSTVLGKQQSTSYYVASTLAGFENEIDRQILACFAFNSVLQDFKPSSMMFHFCFHNLNMPGYLVICEANNCTVTILHSWL